MWSLGFYSLFLGNLCSEPLHLSTSGPSGVDLGGGGVGVIVSRVSLLKPVWPSETLGLPGREVLSIPLWEHSGLGPAPSLLYVQIEQDPGPFLCSFLGLEAPQPQGAQRWKSPESRFSVPVSMGTGEVIVKSRHPTLRDCPQLLSPWRHSSCPRAGPPCLARGLADGQTLLGQSSAASAAPPTPLLPSLSFPRGRPVPASEALPTPAPSPCGPSLASPPVTS